MSELDIIDQHIIIVETTGYKLLKDISLIDFPEVFKFLKVVHNYKKLKIYKMRTEIIPVIHMLDEDQVFKNIELCVDCGIEKVFLINHVVSVQELLMCTYKVKDQYPNLWVGVNMLGMPTHISLSNPLFGIDGLWCDDTISNEQATKVRAFKGMFFGGLAFKYQSQPTDLESSCKEAILATDVATTSGSGTGKAPTNVEINNIRGYLGDHPMAIASGVSVDNVDSYKGIVNYLLVTSSITDANEMIIKDKLIRLKSKLD